MNVTVFKTFQVGHSNPEEEEEEEEGGWTTGMESVYRGLAYAWFIWFNRFTATTSLKNEQ